MATVQDCPTCCPKCEQTFCQHYLKCNTCCGSQCCEKEVCLAPNLDLRYGTLLAQIGTSDVYAEYDPSGVDGLNQLVGVLKYSVHTDENGAIYDGQFNQFGFECPKPTTCMYACPGSEWCAKDLIGNLEAAVASGDARLFGSADSGTFQLR